MTKALAELLDARDYTGLFISQLGWDNPADPRPVRMTDPDTGNVFTARPIAAKRGVTVFVTRDAVDSRYAELLDRALSKRSVERLLVIDTGSEVLWRWPEPRKSGGVRYVTHRHTVGVANPALIQRLNAIRFELDEEDSLNVLVVRDRVRASFNSEEVTKKFYKEFKENHDVLLQEVQGIPDTEGRSWYSSLLLNRLMFIYFMQRKGFLNSDVNYLRNSLAALQALRGRDRFYEYYRDFLIPLFHDGLGSDQHRIEDEEIAGIVGDVPYINGGIFAVHALEARYEISVPDKVFERIFDFFDRYRWHLDERPTGDPEEINPEVLGYIFEQFVNQKEQGAYYTREDVTGYMTASTVIPLFIDRLEDAIGRGPWDLVSREPERYLREALLYGIERPLPEELAFPEPSGSAAEARDSVPDPNLALPGESWWEVVERRRFVAELLERLRLGSVVSANDALTVNLDLGTLARDFIENLDDPTEVAEAWRVLTDLKIIDPTCGSGAFLFAALDILDDLYDAVFSRVEMVLGTGSDTDTQALARVAQEVDIHPSRKYFILKTVVLSNLYGVDLMEEATEIARLRLFLAMVARLEHRKELEPLPDLDMNIRAGNLLVGCTTVDDAELRFEGNVLAAVRLPLIVNDAEEASSLYRAFVNAQQAGVASDVLFALKRNLHVKEQQLREDLDLLYIESLAIGSAVEDWKRSHSPFHWFIEFPEVMSRGGFDAVIGNPPYISRNKVEYQIDGLRTASAPDIYAPCMERGASLVRPAGRYAMIVPISFQFSATHTITRDVVSSYTPTIWCSTYGLWPSSLFTGVGVRNTIVIGGKSEELAVRVTGFRRFHSSFRPHLFDTNRYVAMPDDRPIEEPWPRFVNEANAELFSKLVSRTRNFAEAIVKSGPHKLLMKSTAADFLSVFVDMPPAWDLAGNRVEQTEVRALSFGSERERDLAFVLTAGRLALWWWIALGDDFHVTQTVLTSLPVSLDELSPVADELLSCAAELRAEQPNNPFVTKKAGRLYGNYNLNSPNCRIITDRADQAVLRVLELDRYWEAVRLTHASYQKATSESGSTKRAWPFDWELGIAL